MNWLKKLLNNEGRKQPITLLDAWRIIMHIPVGILIGLLLEQSWGQVIIGLVFAWMWIKYELNEDRHLKDKAFKDIFGTLVGLAIIGIKTLVQ